MTKNAHKIGAIFFLLWGLLHIAGGGLMLAADDAGQQLAMLGTARSTESLSHNPGALVHAGLSFHAFNITWFGIFVAVVALAMNWRNSKMGYWLNVSVAGAADLGLLLFLLLPGYTKWSDGMWGIGLLVIALIFSTIGLRQSQPAIRV